MISETVKGRLDAAEIKRRAAGRWVEILQAVCGLPAEKMNPQVHSPCPQCGGTDRFRAFDNVAETGGLFCNQCFSERNSDGFAAVQWLTGATFPEAVRLVAEFIGSAPASQAKRTAVPERKPLNRIDSNFLKFLEAKGRDLLSSLASELRVSVESLRALGAGFNPDGSVWTFPERTASGEVAGICRRFRDGEKKMMYEHKHGLYFADNWRESSGPILIVEGASDTAAAITLGISAIGRPSAIVPREVLPELVQLLKDVPADRSIIVLGENDQKIQYDDPRWPGKEGAIRTAKELAESLGRPVSAGLPPASVKDLRIWLTQNPEASGSDFIAAIKIEETYGHLENAFEIIDSRTFSETDYSTSFLIDQIMTHGQPQLYGGPSKSLKTSVLVDQCLSLAAGRPFLGRYEVPSSKRVLLLSSESGCSTLKETAIRVCENKDIKLADLGDQLHWGFRPPMLTDLEHIKALTDFILKNRIDIVGIDPAYLSMNLQGNEAANQFAVGAVLMNLTKLQADTGCTPILAAHFRMHMQPGTLPNLEHVAGAGFGQWARQWVLLNRREAFNDENPGCHKLFMAFGGSAGHAGAVALDIEEGHIQDGRFWQVTISQLSAIREQNENDRDARKRDQENRTYENRRAKILQTIRKFPNGETKTQIRIATGQNPEAFEPVWIDLLSSQEVEPCEVQKMNHHGNLKVYPGFRLASKNIEEHRRTVLQSSSS